MAESQHAHGDTEGDEAKAVAEKKKSRRGAGGGQHFARLDVLGVDLEMEYEDVDFEEFEVGSRDSNLDLGRGRMAKEDNDDKPVKIKPFTIVKRSFSKGIDATSLDLVLIRLLGLYFPSLSIVVSHFLIFR